MVHRSGFLAGESRPFHVHPTHRRPLAQPFAVWLVCLGLMVAFGCQKADNRTLLITGPVHVYKTEVPPASYPGTDFIAVLGPNDRPAVLEVRSTNGYRAVKIRLADGREGWVFSGESIDLR